MRRFLGSSFVARLLVLTVAGAAASAAAAAERKVLGEYFTGTW
ncbi:MAG TPA: hypothetical protein PKJ99_14260 [Thermoanaerobaculales bacterium]|nr:hypothetical protein [Thermoanaerobaculales bacterium]HPA83125.1 hypothetical protein [Thermoanaerobaculales bacterium]HQL31012.1 hypothetical protein [Thermoanaerobaculales bacterium]HQN96629.1 hypothetical protein [Thermoanaerobaculales bacterium]HQP44351.1 hypothetical protein [Thermoanaerobaculales bacterium]